MIHDLETRKDVVQEAVQSAATHVGRIASILAGAVVEVTREIGDWTTDVFEMNDAAGKARADRDTDIET